MENYIDLLKLILPEMIVEHFDLIKSQQKTEKLELYFEKKKTQPQEFSDRSLEYPKGFTKKLSYKIFSLRESSFFFM